jgi:hypothetical protein
MATGAGGILGWPCDIFRNSNYGCFFFLFFSLLFMFFFFHLPRIPFLQRLLKFLDLVDSCHVFTVQKVANAP